MDTNGNEKYQKWHRDNKRLYETCGETLSKLIETLLQEEKIPFQSVNYRVKSEDSFAQKCNNTKYTDPINQIYDVCGVRIISFTNSDVSKICDLITKEFIIDSNNSINKKELLGTDKVGYLSVHYIAKFSKVRSTLAEYKSFKNINFEIQIRTLLQHAWAEIEHDRSYKFSGELPEMIKRSFYLVAGTLELLDKEFNRLSDEIDAYSIRIESETKSGNLDVPIDSTSLSAYLNERLKDVNNLYADNIQGNRKIINELNRFDLKTLHDLDQIVNLDVINELAKCKVRLTYTGILRDVMILADTTKYFSVAWEHGWYSIEKNRFDFLSARVNELKKYESILTIKNNA